MKEITPVFELQGKRNKLVGFKAIYNGFVVGTFDNHERARSELDAYVRDTLVRS